MNISRPTLAPTRTRSLILSALVLVLGVIIMAGYSWLLVYRPDAANELTAVFVIGAVTLAILLNAQAGFFLWLFLAPFAPFLPFDIHMPAGIPDLAFTRMIGGFLTVYLLAEIARGRRKPPALTPADLAIPLFVLALILSALRSNLGWLSAVQSAFDSYLVPLLAYFIARQLIQTRRHFQALSAVMLTAAVIIAGLAISEQLFGVTLFRGTTTEDFYSAEGVRKVAALLGNPAYIAITLAVIAPLALVQALTAWRWWKKLGFALILLFIEAGIYLTFNRSGWIGGALAVVTLVILAPQLRRVGVPALLAAGVAGALLWGALENTAAGQRITSESPIDYRLEALQVGLNIYRSDPVLGVGYGSYGRIAARMGFHATGSIHVLSTPHNTYLNMLVSGGAVLLGSFLLVAAALALTLWQIMRRFRARGQAPPLYLLAGWACMAAYFVPSAGFDNNFAIYGNIVFFALMGAILAAALGELDQPAEALTM